MHDLLTEGETYQFQAKDPTSKLEKAIGNAIKELEESNKLAKDQAAHLKPKNSLLTFPKYTKMTCYLGLLSVPLAHHAIV